VTDDIIQEQDVPIEEQPLDDLYDVILEEEDAAFMFDTDSQWDVDEFEEETGTETS
jgi:hypothetical protein